MVPTLFPGRGPNPHRTPHKPGLPELASGLNVQTKQQHGKSQTPIWTPSPCIVPRSLSILAQTYSMLT